MAPAARPLLPVTVLTGYLGAGKTTLLNYILKEQSDKKLVVIENEIGEVTVDDELVENKHTDMAEELVVLGNGCICCTIRGDLVNSLKKIADKYQAGQALDGVLIELTGMADPAPVVQTFFIEPEIAKTFYVDNVVTLVDAKHTIARLDESSGDPKAKGTACAQIAFSSSVLLNKIDLVDADELVEIERRIKELNSTVEIFRCEKAQVPVAKLFEVRAFNLEKVLEEQYMDEEEFNTYYKPKMDLSVSNVGIQCEGSVVMSKFTTFLNHYLDNEETSSDFLRVKGVLNIAGSDDRFVLQCVQCIKNQGFTSPWAEGTTRENRMIFIGRGMEKRRQELTEGFMACFAKPLRFEVGAKVWVNIGDGDDYEEGEVVKHWDECNAYGIKLLSGAEFKAPSDEDRFVKSYYYEEDDDDGACM